MTVAIKVSKTDPFRMGQTITVGASNSCLLCPVSPMKKNLSIRIPTGGPLFIHSSGKPLSKQTLSAETRSSLSQSGFTASHYAGHSYRIGVATTATEAKLPSWLIKNIRAMVIGLLRTIYRYSIIHSFKGVSHNDGHVRKNMRIKKKIREEASRLWGIHTVCVFLGMKYSNMSNSVPIDSSDVTYKYIFFKS